MTSSSGSHSFQAMTGLARRSGRGAPATSGPVVPNDDSETSTAPSRRSPCSTRSMKNLLCCGAAFTDFAADGNPRRMQRTDMDKARWTCDRRFPCKRRLVQRAFGLASSPMKRLTILALLIGAGLAAALILSSGVREVGGAVASVGWGIVPVVLVRVLTVELVGAAWALLFPADLRPRLRVCVLVRYVREGINTLLPLTAVGGEFIGARLLTFYRVEGALVAASVIVDMLVQAGTQFVFTAIGLVALIWLGGDETVVRISAIGLALAAPALAGFYVVQSRGGHRLVQSILIRFAGDREWLAIG